jgi:hypothetical protein
MFVFDVQLGWCLFRRLPHQNCTQRGVGILNVHQDATNNIVCPLFIDSAGALALHGLRFFGVSNTKCAAGTPVLRCRLNGKGDLV